MKKIFYFIASAIVALGAVACQNEGLDNIAPEANGDIVSFVANIDNTKTGLNEELKTVWTAGDAIMVTWNGNTYEFKNSDADVNTFTCQAEGLNAIQDAEEIVATYSENNDGLIDSTAGLEGALLSFEGSFAELKSKGFQVQNAFLKFTTTGAVKLKGDKLFVVDGETVNGIVIEEAGNHYVAINPATATITYDIDGMDVKTSQENTFEARKIYDLGTLEVVASGYNVVGSFQGWDVSVAGAIKMYQYKDWAIAQGVELYKTDEFKIVKGNSWDTSYGLSSVGVLPVDTETKLVTSNSQNMKAAKNGKFDIYFNGTNIKYVCVEEYTDLMVNITIDNKANWSPLYITLKRGNTTIVDNATVTGNKYAVSGNYIGESLSYTLSNGSKTMEGNVTITKDGAIIELEEVEVVTTIVYKNIKSNQQTYWGNNTYLYVWESNSALDTGWPGNKMTKVANQSHTWTITVPSSLVGKTINCIINNGNGWQSKNWTLTIKEGENLLTDEIMGIS